MTTLRNNQLVTKTVGHVLGPRQEHAPADPRLARLGETVDIDADTRIRMARAIGRARASTLQDFEAGRRPEIEGLIGSVIELADRAGVPVPTIRHVAALLTARARSLGLLEPDRPASGAAAGAA